MKITSVGAGILFIAAYTGIYFYTPRNLLGHIFLLPLLVVGLFLFATGARTKSTKKLGKKADQSILDGIINIGIQKIKRGDISIDQNGFETLMEKLKKFVVDQQEVPEFGFNSLYLKFKNEYEAETSAESIRKMGISCKPIQDRGKYYVMIEF